ncbi:MAG: site-specific integrase, partial [Bacteroidetes bacterium]|nr:site-specific integrase [Bacteroidota bacterium]
MKNWERYIKQFVSYLKIERGLAENSIFAYQQDVAKLRTFAEDLSKNPEDLTTQDLHRFLAALYDLGLSARSQARILSGIKQFYDFLILDEVTTENPSELIEMPKIGRKLPEVLSVDEIDQMKAYLDVSKKEGHRNRAILETLYSCGLRVSELVN